MFNSFHYAFAAGMSMLAALVFGVWEPLLFASIWLFAFDQAWFRERDQELKFKMMEDAIKDMRDYGDREKAKEDT